MRNVNGRGIASSPTPVVGLIWTRYGREQLKLCRGRSRCLGYPVADALPTVDELMELADDLARAVENRQAAYEWGYPIGDTAVNEAKAELRAALSRVLEATEAARKERDAFAERLTQVESERDTAESVTETERQAKEAAQKALDEVSQKLQAEATLCELREWSMKWSADEASDRPPVKPLLPWEVPDSARVLERKPVP